MAPFTILVFILAQRIAELLWSYRNTKKLKNLGAQEFFADHYKWIVLFHFFWFISLAAGLTQSVTIRTFPLVMFISLEFCRLWVFLTLGSRWTTRILRVPGERPVSAGPYKWVRHPNYWVVTGEILIVPMIFGFWEFALLGSIIHALIIVHRIKQENWVWRLN